MYARSNPKPRFRPRISLLTALLLMTIVGMAIVVVQLWREVGPLRAEVRQLRTEAGRLMIDDPTKIHVLSVHGSDEVDKSWKWRVYLPPNRKYYLHKLSAKIDAQGMAQTGFITSTSSPISQTSSGEFVIQASVRKGDDGTWRVHASRERVDPQGGLKDRITSTMTIDSTKNWMDGPGGLTSSGVIEQVQKTFEPNKPVELVRVRGNKFTPTYPGSTDPNKKYAGTSATPKGPTDGIIIWIDEQP